MNLKSFTQFIGEAVDELQYQVDRLADWLEGHPYGEDPSFWIPLSPYDFPETREEFLDRLDNSPKLASLLEMDDFGILGVRTEDGWRFWFGVEWVWDREEADGLAIPDEVERMPLVECPSGKEFVAALEEVRSTRLLAIARDGKLGQGIIEEILELGEWGARALAKNGKLAPEWLLRIAGEWPTLKALAEQNPNWPEDVTDWTLGDW
jgi:hypothetical protein